MENNIKIYHIDDEKFVKVRFNFTMDIPINDDIEKIDINGVEDAIFNIDSSDLANSILDNIKNMYIVKESDNVEHIDVKYEESLIDDSVSVDCLIETKLQIDLLCNSIQVEMNKGNKFTIFSVKSNEYFHTDDIKKLADFGCLIYRENNDYYVSWN